jgi:peptide subunit release factor 1 (eRF1)
LDDGIMRVVEDSTIPMVIAGVDYLLPIFRETTSYKNVLEEDIVGSQDRQDLTELHTEAWKLVEPIFRENQQKAIDRFLAFHGQQNGLAVNDLDSAVKAAIGGRVETLIVPLGVQKWGYYDPTTDSVRFDAKSSPENEDMINYAAAQTIVNSGNVYALPADQVPGGGDVAAILRYAI